MTQWGLDTLFNPAKRHMDEEKRRLQSTREEVGDNSGGRRVDFKAGKITIERRTDADADGKLDGGDATATGTAAESDAKNESDAKTQPDAKNRPDAKTQPDAKNRPDAKGRPSAAAIRAAKRRGRSA